MPLLSDPTSIQTALNVEAGRGNPDGKTSLGAYVQLDAKPIVLTVPLRITDAQALVGTQRRTILIWNGPIGTNAVEITSGLKHRAVKDVLIRDVDIYTPNGANAVGIDRKNVNTVEDFRLVNSYINGGAIDLGGENYFCRLEDVRFIDPRGKVLKLAGQGHTIRSTRLVGSLFKGSKAPDCMFDIAGSVTFEGFSRLEGDFGCTLLRGREWTRPDGKIFKGSITAGGNLWIEPNTHGVPPVKLTNCDYYGATRSGNWPPDQLWECDANSTVNLPAKVN